MLLSLNILQLGDVSAYHEQGVRLPLINDPRNNLDILLRLLLYFEDPFFPDMFYLLLRQKKLPEIEIFIQIRAILSQLINQIKATLIA